MLLFVAPALLCASPSSYLIRGIIRDRATGEGLPYASISAGRHGGGTMSDARGLFEITVPDTLPELIIWCQGYERKVLPVSKNRINMYEVLMSPEAVTLNEVVIHKKKYSKKNNPAVDLMQRIRHLSKANDPEEQPYYNYDKYERITLGINDFHSGEGSALLARFPFLTEHVDTSEVSGKPILTLSVKETSSEVHSRRQPRSRHEVVTGLKSEGIDEITDQESMRTFLQDVLREVDLYDKDINILQNRFVSPLSPLAADFYKFYITDTLEIDGDRCIALSFYPHNKSAFGFVGQMYVIPSDTAMFIKRVTMRVPSEINLNFIESLRLNQEFTRAANGSRLKTKDDLTLEIKVLPGTPGLYARRNVAYANHNFLQPTAAAEDSIFSAPAEIMVEEMAENRDSVFWDAARLIPLAQNEGRVSGLVQKLRSVKLYYYGEKFVKYMSSGYVGTAPKNSKFDIGPLNTIISYNSLEGVRNRFGGMTMASLSPHFFARLYGAYGWRDHKWKYGVELEYSFLKKKRHSREFPRHSITLESSYDIDQLGQHYLFTNADNVFLSLKRLDNNLITYLRHNALKWLLELRNGWSFTATVANDCQQSSRLTKFHLQKTATEPFENVLDHFNVSYGEVSIRFAPGEKFYQTRSHRIPINMDAPIITLTHRYAPASGSWSRWGVNRTELSVQKRFWFSAWGYLDVLASGGHIWSKNTPFTQLFTPNVNLSYTIQPESFALMNPMEFVTDSYGSLFLTYWANGAILNYIPLIKKLKLREVFSFSSYMGNLSMRNNPRQNLITMGPNADILAFPSHDVGLTSARHTPYMEVSVGLDNILRCLRVDYVWRLTHRNVPYPIDRSGVRIAFHVTF